VSRLGLFAVAIGTFMIIKPNSMARILLAQTLTQSVVCSHCLIVFENRTRFREQVRPLAQR
jgi:hypothetical protein